ncbi:MAG: hypothetical protein IJO46_01200, partial [Thermoguttaceae bacterium]|nr:hypothetical protein [Thermoguttaceae bacterium]
MKHFLIFTASSKFRNAISLALLSVCLLGASSGCAHFSKKTDPNAKISEFEEDSESVEDNGAKETVFDTERGKQSEMSDFVSSFGRKSKTKRTVDPGQTFLMSDKAKEIY